MCLRGSRAIKNMTFSLKILTFRNTFHNNKTILVAASDKADFNINFKSRDKKIYDFRLDHLSVNSKTYLDFLFYLMKDLSVST